MKRHEVDVFSLLAGLTFTVIAVVYLIASLNAQSVNGRIVIPVALISLGTAGLAGALTRMARRSSRGVPPAEDPKQTLVGAPVGAPAGSRQAGSPGAAPGGTLSGLAPDLNAMGLLDDGPGHSSGPRS
jgi:hypothetical protein